MDIQDIIKTPGWLQVKAILEEIANDDIKAISLTQSSDQIATQYIAHMKAKQIIKRALMKIEKITDEAEPKKISYK